MWWFCCWLIIAAIEKFVIFDKAAAAVDRVGEEAWFPISIFPFKTMFGEDEGSGELEGLAEVGLVGDGKEYSFKWNNDLLLVWCILLKRKYVTYLYVCMFYLAELIHHIQQNKLTFDLIKLMCLMCFCFRSMGAYLVRSFWL